MPIFTNIKPKSVRSKVVTIVADIVIGIFGLSTGAAIVHGTVLQTCQVKKDVFVAGVLPADLQLTVQHQAKTSDPENVQQCLSSNNDVFVAGVLPGDLPIRSTRTAPEERSLAGDDTTNTSTQPSVQGQTPIQAVPQPAPVQTSAPAPEPSPTPKPAVKPSPAPAPKPVAKPTPAPAPKPASTTPKTSGGVDLDKLSKAVAMTETHDCHDKVGSALLNNCFGIKKNGKFMQFETPEASHEYFKQLWVKGYGGFPTMAMAKKYSGNDHPTTWLNSVKYYYNK